MTRSFVEPESRAEEFPDCVKNDPYLVEVKAGDAEFFEEMVAHVAGPNMTPHPRRT